LPEPARAIADPDAVRLFGGLASDWWDPEGRSRLLHRVNPVRLRFVRDEAVAHFGRDPRDRRPLAGLMALDVGCGAGLATEGLARMGAKASGLDASPELVAVARAHAEAGGLSIPYHDGLLADLLDRDGAGRYDLVTCFEVIEHVPDAAAFTADLARALRPGGLLVYSTPNRTAASWAVMILGAERMLRVIPQGGHDWNQFLKPDELEGHLREAGLEPCGSVGLRWSPTAGFALHADRSVNYLGTARKPDLPAD
jgi:2-polyprenyl-6-hydroxyphenyl methylase/3-demethylubiquinone-9 3-methyltransferase